MAAANAFGSLAHWLFLVFLVMDFKLDRFTTCKHNLQTHLQKGRFWDVLRVENRHNNRQRESDQQTLARCSHKSLTHWDSQWPWESCGHRNVISGFSLIVAIEAQAFVIFVIFCPFEVVSGCSGFELKLRESWGHVKNMTWQASYPP